MCDWWLMAVTDGRRRKDPTQSSCGNCSPEFDLIFKLVKNVPFLLSQVCVVFVLKETLPEKNTSHTPLHVIWAISLFKSVKIKKGGHTAHPAHQFWQLFHFWKMSKSIWAEWAWNKRSFFSGKISFFGVQGLGLIRITINGASLCTFYESCQGSCKVSFATFAARLSKNQEIRS